MARELKHGDRVVILRDYAGYSSGELGTVLGTGGVEVVVSVDGSSAPQVFRLRDVERI